MTERNLARDVAAALLAPFDETYDPTETDLRYAENMIESLRSRGLRLLYLDEPVDLTDGGLPALEFQVNDATDPREAYRDADDIAARYFGDERYVLHATEAAALAARGTDGSLSNVRFEVKFRARPIGGSNA